MPQWVSLNRRWYVVWIAYDNGSCLPESSGHDFIHIDGSLRCTVKTPIHWMFHVWAGVAKLGRQVGRGSRVLAGHSSLPGWRDGIWGVVPPKVHLKSRVGRLSSVRRTPLSGTGGYWYRTGTEGSWRAWLLYCASKGHQHCGSRSSRQSCLSWSIEDFWGESRDRIVICVCAFLCGW